MEGAVRLETHDLVPGYSGHALFDGLQLTLRAGELVCLMGPNGIGKSTLIRSLAGLQRPLHGSVKFPTSSESHKPVAVVLADKISGVDLTAYELISFGRYPYLDWTISFRETDLAVIENTIDIVNIRELADKKIYELSDGQLQMVMIARALAQESDVLLLDEPTAHLDLNNRLEIMNLLRRLAKASGKAILTATHELDLALQTADFIWLATRDKKMITGVPEDLILSGAFDEVFQFKGYDLETGKVTQ